MSDKLKIEELSTKCLAITHKMCQRHERQGKSQELLQIREL